MRLGQLELNLDGLIECYFFWLTLTVPLNLYGPSKVRSYRDYFSIFNYLLSTN
jgi:hypothetical protein